MEHLLGRRALSAALRNADGSALYDATCPRAADRRPSKTRLATAGPWRARGTQLGEGCRR